MNSYIIYETPLKDMSKERPQRGELIHRHAKEISELTGLTQNAATHVILHALAEHLPKGWLEGMLNNITAMFATISEAGCMDILRARVQVQNKKKEDPSNG